ncbi:MAG: hypothetical protein LJE94_01580 [Deltaproteobacteria bacterium]|nr:hypothetical protein [Deltaproteobacteria bacterium]
MPGEMRCGYDPSFSYVVIEHRLGLEGPADFIRIQEALSGLKKKIIRQEVVRDPATGENRLVIQMKRQETEEIMLTILGSGLKRDFRCYVY